MTMKRYKPEQMVTLLRRNEVGMGMGKGKTELLWKT